MFGLNFEVRLVVVGRQPRTTTTEAWVVVGEGYIIVVVVVSCCCLVTKGVIFVFGLGEGLVIFFLFLVVW